MDWCEMDTTPSCSRIAVGLLLGPRGRVRVCAGCMAEFMGEALSEAGWVREVTGVAIECEVPSLPEFRGLWVPDAVVDRWAEEACEAEDAQCRVEGCTRWATGGLRGPKGHLPTCRTCLAEMLRWDIEDLREDWLTPVCFRDADEELGMVVWVPDAYLYRRRVDQALAQVQLVEAQTRALTEDALPRQ